MEHPSLEPVSPQTRPTPGNQKSEINIHQSSVVNQSLSTCALTGYRLDTELSSIVQAAHIHQHAVSGNDAPDNGLALTSSKAHRAFQIFGSRLP